MDARKESMIKGGKIALGSTAAIAVCLMLDLDYAPSAGIITLLTIQNTVRATLDLARFRIFSFLLAMGIGFAISAANGNNALSFCIFLLLMVEISFLCGWQDTVSTNAVFGTHIFIYGEAFTGAFLFNEVAILLVGISLAVLLNLKMPEKERGIREDIAHVENSMMRIIGEMARKVRDNAEMERAGEEIEELSAFLDRAIDNAIANRDNTLKEHSDFYIYFFMLRQNQCGILKGLYMSLAKVQRWGFDTGLAADFLEGLSNSFSIHNNVSLRIQKLDAVMREFGSLELPATYEEFQSRAVLYHCMSGIEDFLKLKQVFIARLSEEQRQMYLRLH